MGLFNLQYHLPLSNCLSLRYLSGRVFVLDLIPGSQAHVDKFICPGDIIDEINGTSLRNSKNGQVSSNMPKNQLQFPQPQISDLAPDWLTCLEGLELYYSLLVWHGIKASVVLLC